MEDRDPGAKLMREARAGNTEAFGELVMFHAPSLFRFLGGLTALSMEVREGIAQETFIRAYE